MTSLVLSKSPLSAAFWRRMSVLAIVLGVVLLAPWRVEQNSTFGTTNVEESGEVFYPAETFVYLTFKPIFGERNWKQGSFTYNAQLDLTLLIIEFGALLLLGTLIVAGKYEL